MLINWARPSELYTAFAVGAGVFAGGYALLRVMFAGAGNIKSEPVIALPLKRYKRIMVPTGVGMCSEDYVAEATTLACHLASKDKEATEVVFTYVIPVPRALAVTESMPEEEAEAQRVLDAAAGAARNLRVTNVTTQIRKARTVVEETVRAVEQLAADLVVLTPQTHETAEVGTTLATSRWDTSVPATRAAALSATMAKTDGQNDAQCVAELDTTITSDTSETVTGKLLRRVPCEAIVARRATYAHVPITAPALAFSRN